MEIAEPLTDSAAIRLCPVFPSEAIRLRRIILDLQGISPLLNLGSSTGHFREVIQPHIERELFAPLREAGVRVVHCDLKEDEGVDFAGDILDPEVIRRLKTGGFKCILLSNLLEHVRDREAVAAACEEIVGPGGFIVATVPSSYPYHADPIDTYYRPSPAELAKTFGRSELLIGEEVEEPTYAEELRARGISVGGELIRTVLWSLIFFVRPRSAAARLHRWRWYSKPRRVAIARLAVRRPSA
jgi:SAM-dependent methyltransferase